MAQPDFDKFSGVFPAILTPINDDLTCNHDELVKHIKDLMGSGCKGIVLFGTTGEGTSFSVKEKINTIENVIQQGISPDSIIVGVGCSSIDEAVDLTRASVENKCSSVLMHPPYFFKNLQDDGIISFYREVINRVAKPELRIFLYHIPQLTCVPISPHVIKSLKAEFPETIIGIKDSAGVGEFTRNILKLFPNLTVMLGSEKNIPDLIKEGATGVISGLANICPQLICNQLNFGKNEDLPDREEDVKRYLDLMRNYFFIQALKAILASKKGHVWKLVRPPLSNLSIEDCKDLVERSNALAI
jgi:4-hydroxy-tetrahydrodipicolinate synthase